VPDRRISAAFKLKRRGGVSEHRAALISERDQVSWQLWGQSHCRRWYRDRRAERCTNRDQDPIGRRSTHGPIP
jgi:hypothetical protein